MSQQVTASLVDAISALPKPYPTVSLITNYKGTTLNQPGRIVAVDSDSVTIQATQRSTFPILVGTVHLCGQNFPGAISATIHPVDYLQGTFNLFNLSYSGWQERKTQRVQPKNPTYVEIYIGRKTFRAALTDICTEGVGILANKSIDPDDRLQIGVKPLLAFQLGREHLFNHLKGLIVYRQIVGQDLIRLGLQLFPDAYQKTTLKEYISTRRAEILNELEQDYIQIGELCRVENLYF